MGNFEMREYTCEDCQWGGQCPAEYICEEFDLADETEDIAPPDRDAFEKEYQEYCSSRQGPREKVINVGARPLAAILNSDAEV